MMDARPQVLQATFRHTRVQLPTPKQEHLLVGEVSKNLHLYAVWEILCMFCVFAGFFAVKDQIPESKGSQVLLV